MPIINWTNITDFGDIPSQANNATGGLFWTSTLYMVWVVMILVLIYWGFEIAILVSSFLAMIIAIILVYADLIAWYHAITFAGIILFMFLYIIWSGRKTQ